MSIMKYFMLLELLTAIYSIIKFFMTPLEEMMTIQTAVFYMLITWSIFGLMYMTKIMDEDWSKLLKNNKDK